MTKNSTIQGLWDGQKILFQDLKWKIPNDDACYGEVIPNQSPPTGFSSVGTEKNVLKTQHGEKKMEKYIQRHTDHENDRKRKNH